jgi:hypothetical protein
MTADVALPKEGVLKPMFIHRRTLTGLVLTLLTATGMFSYRALAQKPSAKPEPVSALPARVFAPITAAIDRELDKHLAQAGVPASPRCDDAEFLRRVSLDITGRIPTLGRTTAFLDSSEPDKRRKLIDELLSTQQFGQHFGTIWRNLLAPPDPTTTKAQPDRFSPWLAEQFNHNRGWDKIVYELLTIEGDVNRTPQMAFLMANSESFEPKPNLLAAATMRYFLGVQLQCAECHNHPFARWTQEDFWSTAAFFSWLRKTGGKGPPFIIGEAAPDPLASTGKKGEAAPPPPPPGAAIAIPSTSGKNGGKIVKARFLGGEEPKLEGDGPFRPRFAQWVVAPENPYFARAFVNRVWSQFFGRGFVNPVDNFHDDNAPSHPELLQLLAEEFKASGHDFKHLVRCLCNSQAYQRTSRSLPENEGDKKLFSRMVVKVMSPESFYDSLTVLLTDEMAPASKSGDFKSKQPAQNKPKQPAENKPKQPTDNKPKQPNEDKAKQPTDNKAKQPTENKPKQPDVKQPEAKGKGMLGNSRDQFIQFFRGSAEAAEAGEFRHGIPQFLRRMNAEEFNNGSALIARLNRPGSSRDQVIEGLYLATLSRRPTATEVQLMSDYVSRRNDVEKGYAGVLWILLNSGEFVLNH